MKPIELNDVLLTELKDKTVIVTGAAGGIGAEAVRLFNANGANVVVADLERTRNSADDLISSLPAPARASFVAVSITDWAQMQHLFRTTVAKFGCIDIVVANAAVMESSPVVNSKDSDANDDLEEPIEAYKVIDTNLKGTLNTLCLAHHHMKSNSPRFSDGSRGSVVLVSSTSGYFGGTGVIAYIASKHGVTGLLRAFQPTCTANNIRVNAVAPSFTPTQITAGLVEKWKEAGMESNTPQSVAAVIAQMSVDPSKRGACCLVAGRILREMEESRQALVPDWLGEDVSEMMSKIGTLLVEMGGYPLPKLPSQMA